LRPSQRLADALRPVSFETGVNRYAEGSCLISFGHTKVLVTASVDESVPGFLRGRGQGWVTLGERQISIDCDVIQADGGTRTASITGAWVALRLATRYLLTEGVIATDPILDQVAAISCGVHQDTPVLDLDYEEDSSAEADANFVLTGAGDIVEIQATGEKRGFSQGEFETLFSLARKGIGELIELQKTAAG
jgi:ribonuclease PH